MTQGLSVNQALGSSFVTADGYRHATVSEVEALFINAGFVSTNNVNDPANDPAAALLLGLMGVTQFPGTNFETGRGFAESALPFYSRPNYHEGPLGGGAAVISLQTSDLDLVDATSGHFLVRSASQTPVPEPSTIALLSFGLFGLVMYERRRKNRA